MTQAKRDESDQHTPALERLSSTWNAYNAGGATQDDATRAIRAALDAGSRWPEIGRAMGHGPRRS